MTDEVAAADKVALSSESMTGLNLMYELSAISIHSSFHPRDQPVCMGTDLNTAGREGAVERAVRGAVEG